VIGREPFASGNSCEHLYHARADVRHLLGNRPLCETREACKAVHSQCSRRFKVGPIVCDGSNKCQYDTFRFALRAILQFQQGHLVDTIGASSEGVHS
jgi:hypothetical protein